MSSYPSQERGGALIIVLLILVALLAGGGSVLYLQAQSTRTAGLVKGTRKALYCAEAGLVAARPQIASRMGEWPLLIDADAGNDPAWYPVRGDLDGDNEIDYEVTVRDNDDEIAPTANNLTADIDLQIFVVSRCVSTPDTPREILELVSFESGGNVYRHQSGQGSGNTGNAN